jgi:alpha,alpha-trehalase
MVLKQELAQQIQAQIGAWQAQIKEQFCSGDRRLSSVLAGLALLAACGGPPALHGPATTRVQAVTEIETPIELYGELFEDVQMQRVFPDGKTFVDALPKNETPAAITKRYREEKGQPGFDLAAFVNRHFIIPRADVSTLRQDGHVPRQDVCSHIDALWSVLERKPDQQAQPYSSRLPLPEPYVVPGGRFREIYYWDSYFTMLGLEESGHNDLALSMVRNFASLIDRYGHVPNGNRTYYLSRSQPPFFATMVELVADDAPDQGAVYAEFLPALSREYDFWMEGADTLAPGSAHRRIVRLADGTLLNRYWDDRDIPREEAYREDVHTAQLARRPPAEVYRDLRAGAESGWDFSSRWFQDGRTLATVRTTALIPVDLNSLMFQLEMTLAHAYDVAGQPERATEFRDRAEQRKAAVQRYFWDWARGVFTDYLWREDRTNGTLTAATLSPLFFGIATPEQARRVAALVRTHLLQPGGLVTSTVASGQQWDAPNGWAPLQWIAIKGLNDYGETALAATIAKRWMGKVITAYDETGKLMEKYDVADATLVTGGGEYPTQDGFGWTNGVLRKLLVLYPNAVAPRSGAGWCARAAANDNVPAARPRSGQEAAVAR